jgi:hypothetical protein
MLELLIPCSNGSQSGADDPGQSREDQLATRNTASPIPPAVQNNMWYSCRRLIYIKTNPKVNSPVGHWPIPESFWPDHSTITLVSINLSDNKLGRSCWTKLHLIQCHVLNSKSRMSNLS